MHNLDIRVEDNVVKCVGHRLLWYPQIIQLSLFCDNYSVDKSCLCHVTVLHAISASGRRVKVEVVEGRHRAQ